MTAPHTRFNAMLSPTLTQAHCIVPDWPAPENVRALITTREGGVTPGTRGSLNLGKSVGDEAANVAENRVRVAQLVGAPPRWMGQVHGIDVAKIDELPLTTSISADAQVAHGAKSIATVMTADCLPLLLCDQRGSVVASVHAGWRGLCAGVIEAALAAMDVAAKDVLVYLGPAIGASAFEVGTDVREAFLARDPDFSVSRIATEAAFLPSATEANEKWLADIYALARNRLRARGVGDSQVFGGQFCTYTQEPLFFSHRRSTHTGEPTGRMASLIWREA
jgi:polyphenol oxidase